VDLFERNFQRYWSASLWFKLPLVRHHAAFCFWSLIIILFHQAMTTFYSSFSPVRFPCLKRSEELTG
jgi:hypothetical protein